MNKIEELITQLCPDGVEFKELWELTIWDKKFNGLNKSMQKTVISYPYVLANTFKELEVKNGNVRLLSTGNYTGWTTEELAGKNLCEGEVVAIPWGGQANVKYYKGKFVTADNRISISIDPSIFLIKFLYYWFLQNNNLIASFYRGSGIKHPRMRSVLTMKIPFPPLPIQQEIVAILDRFTQLEAELEAELEARKSQYEFYRNQMLNFEGEKVQWKTLGEVGEFVRGRRFVKNDIMTEGVPCIHYGEMYTYYHIWAKKTKSFLNPTLAAKLRVARTGDVIIVAAGETVEDLGQGVAWLGESDVVIHDACFTFSHKQNPKYVSHLLQTELFRSQIKKYVSSGKISSINAPGLSKALIPIPSLAEQERIVDVLDKFDALVNDISVGIPAEIEARRKQYEYYRGKLLDFKDINNG
jgi:type I restriction enzyme, S subunit